MENGNGLSLIQKPTMNELESTVQEVASLQQQISQLLDLQKEAESENQKLAATLNKEKEQKTISQKDGGGGGSENNVQKLEQDLQIRTEERENYKNKLQLAEKRIVELEAEVKKKGAVTEGETGPMTDQERASVKEALDNLTETLASTTMQCDSFQRQNTQMQSQVKALKEVIAIHKDLLGIRGMETEQLKTTIRLLEDHALAEKERRNAVLNKMETAVKLNAELKNEYENQLSIFQDLKGKYEQKVGLIQQENERLKSLIPPEMLDVVAAEPVLEQ